MQYSREVAEVADANAAVHCCAASVEVVVDTRHTSITMPSPSPRPVAQHQYHITSSTSPRMAINNTSTTIKVASRQSHHRNNTEEQHQAETTLETTDDQPDRPEQRRNQQ
jgi:hypothetical protein